VAQKKQKKKNRKEHHHLPKVGTPQNDAYRLKRSREDLVNFGLTHPGRSTLTWVLGIVAVIFLLLTIISFIAIT